MFLLCGTALRLARAPSLTFITTITVDTVESQVFARDAVGPAVGLGF